MSVTAVTLPISVRFITIPTSIREHVIRWFWEGAFPCKGDRFFFVDGGFFCAIGGSPSCKGPTSIASSGSSPGQENIQHQRHERFHLPSIPCGSVTIVRRWKVRNYARVGPLAMSHAR